MTNSYKTGTVSVTNGSAVVNGTGTAWAIENVVGGMFRLGTFEAEIIAATNTQLTLDTNYTGVTASGQAYRIWLQDAQAASNITINRQLGEIIARLVDSAPEIQDFLDAATADDALTALGGGEHGKLIFGAATKSAANAIVVSDTNYDVQARHSLDGTSGDRAKILAAIAAAPKGATLHWGPVLSVLTAGVIINKQFNHKFHGTRWSMDFGADTSSDLVTIEIPGANTVSGDCRRMEFDGLWTQAISGGRHAINIKKGAVGQGQLISSYRNLLLYSGANADGFGLNIEDTDFHWNHIETSMFNGRGIGLFGADGNRISKCLFTGDLGIYLDVVAGAFFTEVTGCAGSMDELAVHVSRGSNAWFHGNSWEQAAISNTGAHSCQFLISPQHAGSGIHGLRIADNFGGGGNVGRPVRIDSGASGVYDTWFDECTFHPGSSETDILIADAGVYETCIGSKNIARGTRTSPDLTRSLSVSDSGTGTQGVWKSCSGMGLSNSWAVGNSEIMVDPYTKQVVGRGSLVPGTLSAATKILTLPVGMRPKHFSQKVVMPNSGTSPKDVYIYPNGDLTTGGDAFVGTALDLSQFVNFPIEAKASYVPGA